MLQMEDDPQHRMPQAKVWREIDPFPGPTPKLMRNPCRCVNTRRPQLKENIGAFDKVLTDECAADVAAVFKRFRDPTLMG